MYFRLRGTNLGVDVPGQTQDGQPLVDEVGQNDEAMAWKDIWFYSNPIFLNVKQYAESRPEPGR